MIVSLVIGCVRLGMCDAKMLQVVFGKENACKWGVAKLRKVWKKFRNSKRSLRTLRKEVREGAGRQLAPSAELEAVANHCVSIVTNGLQLIVIDSQSY